METDSRIPRSKLERDDKKSRLHRKDSKESQKDSEDHSSSKFALLGTPFTPRMAEHVDQLLRIKHTKQRHEFVMRLHQTYGSRYVQRLIDSINVQAKLTVSAPNNIYEQEADQVADAVAESMTTHTQLQDNNDDEIVQSKSYIHRQETEDEELQMKPNEIPSTSISDNLEKKIDGARSTGRPLSDEVKNTMEQAFGTDFNGVRTHTDSESDMLNKQLNAKAFTTGQDIFFREGEYSPGTDSGRHLIAHELTHVVQQSGEKINRDMIKPVNSMLKQAINPVAMQSEGISIQREWNPTPEDLEFLNKMHPSALDFYSINDYIRYSGLYSMLEGFTQSEFSAENIHFLKDMEEYGQTPEQAEDIWHKYLMVNAKEEINLPGNVMDALKAIYSGLRQQAKIDFESKTGESAANMTCPVCGELVLDSAHVPTKAQFDAVKKEISKLVEGDTLKRFIAKAKNYALG